MTLTENPVTVTTLPEKYIFVVKLGKLDLPHSHPFAWLVMSNVNPTKHNTFLQCRKN